MKQSIIYIVSILFILGLIFYGYINRKLENNNLDLDNIVKKENILQEENKTEETKEEVKEENQINNNQNKKQMTQATFKTNIGEFTIELYNEQTPKTVDNFITLASDGFYNGTKFHRIIKDFMNQGGDPLSKDDSMEARWGTGGPGYKFNDEITLANKNVVGTISMANAGPNTNGSQFFINVADNSFLDTKHTVFGKVVSGLDVVLAMNKVATNEYDRPLSPVIIESITLK